MRRFWTPHGPMVEWRSFSTSNSIWCSSYRHFLCMQFTVHSLIVYWLGYHQILKIPDYEKKIIYIHTNLQFVDFRHFCDFFHSSYTGFPLGLENLEILKKWEGIFQSGKSQGILNRLEKSGKSQGKSYKILENSGNLKLILFDIFSDI